MTGLLPPLKPLPIKERISVVFVEYGEIDMLDGAFVVVDAKGIRTHIPVGGVATSDSVEYRRTHQSARSDRAPATNHAVAAVRYLRAPGSTGSTGV